jgi:hypothetical protein
MTDAHLSYCRALALGFVVLCANACSDMAAPGEGFERAVLLPQLTAPNGVTIRGVRARGTGCRSGTYEAQAHASSAFAGVAFSDYSLERTSDFQTRNCSILVDVDLPPDTSVYVDTLVLSGYTYQSTGVTSKIAATYTFLGGTGTGPGVTAVGSSIPEFRHFVSGPSDGTFVVEDIVEEGRRSFSDCKRSVTAIVNTWMDLDDPTKTGYGFASVASVEKIGLSTRPCPKGDAAVLDAGHPDGESVGESDADIPELDAGTNADGGEPQPSARPKIVSVQATGRLCASVPLGSVIIDDGRDVYLAPVPPASTKPFVLGGCVISLAVVPPPGQQLTLDGFDARSAVSLESATKVKLFSSFDFLGNVELSVAQEGAGGPSGEFAFPGDFRFNLNRPYSACGEIGYLNVYLDVVLVGAIAPTNRVSISRFTGLQFRLRSCGSPD